MAPFAPWLCPVSVLQHADVKGCANARGTHDMGVDTLEQHHSATSVSSGKVEAIIVELHSRDDVRCSTTQGTEIDLFSAQVSHILALAATCTSSTLA